MAGAQWGSSEGNIESGEPLKDNNCPASARSENRKPICAIARGSVPRRNDYSIGRRGGARRAARLRAPREGPTQRGDIAFAQRQFSRRGIVGGMLRRRGFWNGKHARLARQKTQR